MKTRPPNLHFRRLCLWATTRSITCKRASLFLLLDHNKLIASILNHQTMLYRPPVLPMILGSRGVVRMSNATQYRSNSQIICSSSWAKALPKETAGNPMLYGSSAALTGEYLNNFSSFKLYNYKSGVLIYKTVQRNVWPLLIAPSVW